MISRKVLQLGTSNLKPVHMTRLAYVCKFFIYVNFAYVCKSGQVYAFTQVCKFARMQKLENLQLPQTKCKSHFEYIKILHICANLVMYTESKICTREYLVNNAE